MLTQYIGSLQGKTLLIIGAGHEQVPAIEIAKSAGIKVLVTDLNPNAPGAKLADVFAPISTADKDQTLAFAEQAGIQGVMTLSSELAVPVVAYVAEKLGLNSGLNQEIALKATNKNEMHQAFLLNQTPCAESIKLNRLHELLSFVRRVGFPVVLKPSDSSGQKGVGIFSEISELEVALQEAIDFSSDGFAIAEEYIEGPEINVTAMVQNGDVNFLSFSHRVTASAPHFGIAIDHIAPPPISTDLLKEVKIAAEKAIHAIGLKNGIAYPQIIASESRGAKVLEIAARIPGGYMRDVALLLSGVDMIEVMICQSLGVHLPFEVFQNYPSYPAVHVKFLTELDYPELKRVSVVSGFANQYSYPDINTESGVLLSECRLQAGMTIPSLTSSSARFAAIIGYGATLEQADAQIEHAQKQTEIA